MLGFGETSDEVLELMDDLRKNNCEILTIGQYLQPSKLHFKLQEFVRPEIFEKFKTKGEEKGFLYVVSGPLVRSSYKAGELFIKNKRNTKED